jgi:hypothetical protein
MLLLLLRSSCATGERAVLTIVEFTTWSYQAEIADFGNSMKDRYRIYGSRLMTPPDDPRLCEFPESLLHFTNNSISVDRMYRTPIALLVSLDEGGCSPITKVRVAMEIQKKVTSALQYVVFYNNDPDDHDSIISLQYPALELSSENFDEIGLVSVSTSTGISILGRIKQLAVVTGTNPQFMAEGNRLWQLPTVIERLDNYILNQGAYSNRNTQVNGSNFYWFRFVLFTLLIVSPCCRAGYLWWAGGGRFCFRRNENGRIVGFQYIPPMSYWFASTGGMDHRPTSTGSLTEEQVLALPEIIYKAPTDQEVDEDSSTHDEDLEDVDIVVSAGTDDIEQAAPKDEDHQTAAIATLSNGVDVDEVEQQEFITTCTSCSICIDDFEAGERLRILPRCKHAFHTDCIMPWLTERQGSCPLCKTDVMERNGPEEGYEGNEQAEDHEIRVEPDGTEPSAVSSFDEEESNHPAAFPLNDESIPEEHQHESIAEFLDDDMDKMGLRTESSFIPQERKSQQDEPQPPVNGRYSSDATPMLSEETTESANLELGNSPSDEDELQVAVNVIERSENGTIDDTVRAREQHDASVVFEEKVDAELSRENDMGQKFPFDEISPSNTETSVDSRAKF